MKKRLLALILSAMMIMALLPSMALAYQSSYSSPTIWPQQAHPKVMFNAGNIEEIRANLTASQNSAAYQEFQRLIGLSAKSQTFSTLNGYWDESYECMIEALAFDYAINGNTQNGNYAIARMKEYLSKVTAKNGTSDSMSYRYYGAIIFHAAEVLDWCYPLISSSDANAIIGYCDTLIQRLEIYTKGDSNKINGQGGITSHGSENQLLRDILALGIATYNTNSDAKFHRTDIYPLAMGRLQDEYVPVRNYIYQSGTTHQGSEYGWYRFYWDLCAETLVERMKQYNSVTLFDRDAMKDVLYGMIYSRRPDGRFFTEGDNQHSDYWYYNNLNRQAAKLAGDLFDDEYFKGEYRNMVGSEMSGDTPVFQNNTNFKNYMSFNSVQWLIMNNPEVPFTTERAALDKSKYFGGPIGKIYAKTGWGYSKTGPKDYGVAAAEMKIGEQYSANHDHLDAGTFQLYFRGLMTGDYGSQNQENSYGDSFDKNYYKRTVAHNGITIYKSGESWATTLDPLTGTTSYASSNDGGQLASNEEKNYDTWTTRIPFRRASVINHSIADDNSYSYIKGDITNAYDSSKADAVVRSMAFLPTGQAGAPAVMVVFDKVTSDSSSYTKKFLMHTAAEPTVTNNNRVQYDNTNTLTYSNGTSVTYGGRLVMNTLLPASATITKVSGTKVGSTTYSGPSETKFEPEWGRVEVQAASEGKTTKFLNVLTLSDTYRVPADATMIGTEGTDKLLGARIKYEGYYDMVAMFADTGASSLSESASFTVSGEDEDVKIFIFGLGDGRWTVKKDGARVGVYDVNGTDGTLTLTGDSGTYSVAPYNAATDRNDAIVCWYDYRLNDGMDVSDDATEWADLSSAGNNMPINLTGDTYWKKSGDDVTGLRIQGNGSDVTALPDAVKNALNGSSFTLSFFISDINQRNTDECISLIGDVKSNFAIYKIIGANKIYLKLPGTKTIVRRTWWYKDYDNETHSKGIDGHYCTITLDRSTGALKWYIDGQLVRQSNYTTSTAINDVSLLTESGNSAVYKQIKVFNIALDAEEVAEEYQAYVQGPQ